MTRVVRNSRAPIFFFQAANDYDLSPSQTLSAAMKDAGKTYEVNEKWNEKEEGRPAKAEAALNEALKSLRSIAP